MPASGEEVVDAAGRLGSMTLGAAGSNVETSSGKPKDTDEKSEKPMKTCSSCGGPSGALKKCTACKCVWYCDVNCQKAHRADHKAECKRIAKVLKGQAAGIRPVTTKRIADMNLDVEDPSLFDDPPPREDCALCMHMMPLENSLCEYNTCCGKLICGACAYRWVLTNEEKDLKCHPMLQNTCPFCREPIPRDDKEAFKQTVKRVEIGDALAAMSLAYRYNKGEDGLQVNEAKALELFQKAADLGSPEAWQKLGNAYIEGKLGLGVDKAKGRAHWERAAKGGNVLARHNLGVMESKRGNNNLAIRHWRISAAAGYNSSVDGLIKSFEVGILCREDLAESMQARDVSCTEMKSDDRDRYIEFMNSEVARSLIV